VSPAYKVYTFYATLCAAFGWRYVAIASLVYGVTEGLGESLLIGAERYYLFDTQGLSASRFTQVAGFGEMPWQIKALYGMAADSVSFFGYQKSPYMIGAGICGMLAGFFLFQLKATVMIAAVLLISSNFSVAVPDVMIDGSTGECANTHPELASEVQTAINAAYQGCSFFADLAVGYLVRPSMIGAEGVFGLFSLTSLIGTIIPTALGWMGEKRDAHPDAVDACYSRDKLQELAKLDAEKAAAEEAKKPPKPAVMDERDETKEHVFDADADLEAGQRARKPVFRAAMANVVCSLVVGITQLTYTAPDAALVNGIITVILGAALAVYVYVVLRQGVSIDLAGAAVFIFMEGVCSPSAELIFQWSHDDGESDGNCARSCDDDTDEDECGWARDRDYPCISPVWWGYARGVSRIFGFLGVILYNVMFSHWSYKNIFALGTFLYFCGNMLDFIWVSRFNRVVGVSDLFFLFGVEMIQPVMKRLRIMPVFVLAAKLCPKSVEATLFALLMGLINLGSAIGKYNAVALLAIFGGVEAPEFKHLQSFILVRTLIYLIPLFLIPCFAPSGGPRDTPTFGDAHDDVAKALKATAAASDVEMTPMHADAASGYGKVRKQSSSLSDSPYASSSEHKQADFV